MQTHNTARAVAVASGCLATAGALAILTSDAIASGHWTLEHAMMPLIVALTIAGAHFAPRAARERRIGYAFGWGLVFVAGLAAQLYTSAGKQAAGAQTQIDDARARAGARTRAEARVTDLIKDVGDARRAQAAECASGEGTRCKGAGATLRARLAELAVAEADLGQVAPAPVAAPNADRAASIIAAIWGGDRDAIKALFVLLEPLRYTVLLELGALVSFGYAFGGSCRTVRSLALRRRIDIEAQEFGKLNGSAPETNRSQVLPNHSDRSARPATERRPEPAQIRTVRRRGRTEAEADLVTMIALGRTVPSQQALADRWGVSKSTVHKWLARWDAQGLTRRRVEGKRKVVAAA